MTITKTTIKRTNEPNENVAFANCCIVTNDSLPCSYTYYRQHESPSDFIARVSREFGDAVLTHEGLPTGVAFASVSFVNSEIEPFDWDAKLK